MQGKHLFEYAVIRIVPCVEKEEFLNAGVILYCASQQFLQTIYKINKERLNSLCDELNIDEVEKRLKAFTEIAQGLKEGGTIAELPIASRFRWLTSARSTIVQTSAVHPGLCDDANETILKLFHQMVS